MNINLYGMLFLGVICIILYLEILTLKKNIKNTKNKEQFTVSDEIKQTVMNTVDQVYNMDTEAIRNLGAISKSILTGRNYHNMSGTVTPGDLIIPANTTIDGNTNINGDITIDGNTNVNSDITIDGKTKENIFNLPIKLKRKIYNKNNHLKSIAKLYVYLHLKNHLKLKNVNSASWKAITWTEYSNQGTNIDSSYNKNFTGFSFRGNPTGSGNAADSGYNEIRRTSANAGWETDRTPTIFDFNKIFNNGIITYKTKDFSSSVAAYNTGNNIMYGLLKFRKDNQGNITPSYRKSQGANSGNYNIMIDQIYKDINYGGNVKLHLTESAASTRLHCYRNTYAVQGNVGIASHGEYRYHLHSRLHHVYSSNQDSTNMDNSQERELYFH